MEPGEQIQGRYVLECPLGRGGMAEVWKARDERLDRPVAIKFLSKEFADNPEFLVRFFSEAQSVARISHPNVVEVLDFGEHNGRPLLVMEYVSGGSLADMQGERVTPERAFEIVGQVASGVGAAHHLGLVHRDIKPGNILLDEHGTAKIADFGISSSGVAERMTATGAAIGSPHFISPEQVSGHPATPASDVYSLGIVLYELLTGRRPFEGDNITAVAIAHVDKTPLPPSAHEPSVEMWVDSFVLRCLDKEPQVRFPDGDALAAALAAAEPGDYSPSVVLPAVGDSVSDDEEAGWDDEEESPKGRRTLVGAGLILLLLGLASAGVIAASRQGSEALPELPEKVTSEEKDRRGDRKPKPSPSPSLSDPAVTGTTVQASPTPTPEDSEEEGDRDGREGSASDGDKDQPEPDEEPEPEPEPEPSEEPEPEPTSSPTAEPSPSSDERADDTEEPALGYAPSIGTWKIVSG